VIDLLGEDLPAEDTPFSSDDAPGWEGDGDFLGPWPPQAVLKWFPEDLIDEYGGKVEPNPNGENLELPADAGDRSPRNYGHAATRSRRRPAAIWLPGCTTPTEGKDRRRALDAIALPSAAGAGDSPGPRRVPHLCAGFSLLSAR